MEELGLNDPCFCLKGIPCRTKIRVGHADASADAHRMRINAHRCASSAYCAKNDIPFCTYKLPFWLRFSKSLGPEPHQLTNISYVESGEVLSFCVNEAREYLYRYLFQLYSLQLKGFSPLWVSMCALR